MAISTEGSTSSTFPSKSASIHPFAPLSADEIKQAARLIRIKWPEDTNLHFKAITLQEPLKAEVIPVLEAESKGETWKPIDRRAFVLYYLRGTVSTSS